MPKYTADGTRTYYSNYSNFIEADNINQALDFAMDGLGNNSGDLNGGPDTMYVVNVDDVNDFIELDETSDRFVDIGRAAVAAYDARKIVENTPERDRYENGGYAMPYYNAMTAQGDAEELLNNLIKKSKETKNA